MFCSEIDKILIHKVAVLKSYCNVYHTRNKKLNGSFE